MNRLTAASLTFADAACNQSKIQQTRCIMNQFIYASFFFWFRCECCASFCTENSGLKVVCFSYIYQDRLQIVLMWFLSLCVIGLPFGPSCAPFSIIKLSTDAYGPKDKILLESFFKEAYLINRLFINIKKFYFETFKDKRDYGIGAKTNILAWVSIRNVYF